MRWLCLLALAGCINEAQCLERQEDARVLARTHATADTCTYAPQDVAFVDCSGVDERPQRAYIGAWCSLASFECIDALPDAQADCFGRPIDP